MRPVDRGSAERTYSNYADAQPDLVDRMGGYCSYCERQIETNLAVEHVRPKSLEPQLERTWSNFLLGCTNCNSTKGNTPVNLDEYVWPDVDNTLRAFVYKEGGIIEPALNLSSDLRAKAEALMRLVGLDKYPGNQGRRPTKKDLRWQRRREAREKAKYAQSYLSNTDTPEARELIVRWFKDTGMFSIWYSVFVGDADMRRRLVEAIPGTAADCFDERYDPIARPGGKL